MPSKPVAPTVFALFWRACSPLKTLLRHPLGAVEAVGRRGKKASRSRRTGLVGLRIHAGVSAWELPRRIGHATYPDGARLTAGDAAIAAVGGAAASSPAVNRHARQTRDRSLVLEGSVPVGPKGSFTQSTPG